MPSSYTIGEHYDAFIKKLVESGRYMSASEVVREGLRLVEEQEQLRAIKLKALKEAIQEGLDSGEAEPWDIEDIKREGRRILAERAKASRSDAA